MRPPHAPEALRQGPFTAAQAAEFGVTRRMLQSRVWRRVLRNVYVHAEVSDSRAMRAKAASLALGGEARVFLCGISAAWVYGLDLHPWREAIPSLQVGCRNGDRAHDRPGWRVRELTVTDADLVQTDGIWVTTPLRTAFDCARWLPRPEAVVVLDYLAHAGLIELSDVTVYAERQPAVRWKRRVAEIVELSDGRAESPPESRLRVWLVLEGLHPVPQHVICDEQGLFVARVDLALIRERIAIEYQGRPGQRLGAVDERLRRILEDLGWKVLYVCASDLADEGARRQLMFDIRAEVNQRRHEPAAPPADAAPPAEVAQINRMTAPKR